MSGSIAAGHHADHMSGNLLLGRKHVIAPRTCCVVPLGGGEWLCACCPPTRIPRGARPLVAGYLWLLFIWLSWDIDFPRSDQLTDGEPLERVYALEPLVQGVGATVLLSVAAYLVGSLATGALGLLVRQFAGVGHTAGLVSDLGRAADLSGRDTPMIAWSRDALRRIEAEFVADAKRGQQAQLTELSHTVQEMRAEASAAGEASDGAEDIRRQWEHLASLDVAEVVRTGIGAPDSIAAQMALETLRNDFDGAPTQLLAVNPVLHAEVDRRDGEAVFRLSISSALRRYRPKHRVGRSDWWAAALLIVVSAAVAGHGIELRRQAANSLALALRSLPQVGPAGGAPISGKDSRQHSCPRTASHRTRTPRAAARAVHAVTRR